MDVLPLITGTRAGEVSASVEAAIRRGDLQPGQPLPPVRRLASSLGLSPTTVAAAYRDLQIRGLLTAAGRRGTRVSPRPPLAARASRVVPAGARDLTHGNPDAALLPDLEPFLRDLRPGHRLYGEPTNRRDLLELAAAGFRETGISPDFLAVVGGALDGIERTLRAHLRPGDRVAIEDPAYPAVYDLLLALGLVPVPLPVDERGFLPAEFEQALPGTAAVLVTPRAQNPTGAALDEQRARQLRRALAKRRDVLVIEDDHAGAIAGTPAVTLCAPTPPGHWAVVRSVSKALGPDLRLAVMAGDAVTISRVEGLQQIGAGWVSHILQKLVVDLMKDPATAGLMERATRAYAERRRALIRALAGHGLAAWGRSGLNVWVPVPDEDAAVRRLLEAGWAVARGERFRLLAGPGIRISIATLDPADARRLAADLARPAAAPPTTRSA